MIIGIDPSITHCAYVLLNETKTGKEAFVKSGTFITEHADALFVQRLIMQRERLRHLLTSNNIKFVAMEAPIWGDNSTELLYALHQFFHEVFLELKIYLIYLQPSTVKKYAYPDMDPDNISKSHMTHAAKKELDLMNKRFSEHEADAYFVGKIGLKYYQWLFLKKFSDHELSEAEQHLFCGKHTFVKGIKKGITEYTGIIYRENERFYDYTKQMRTSQIIKQEIINGVQTAKKDPARKEKINKSSKPLGLL
jgi:Holliday junction resolvasome RuvABC endonuclease subunit